MPRVGLQCLMNDNPDLDFGEYTQTTKNETSWEDAINNLD